MAREEFTSKEVREVLSRVGLAIETWLSSSHGVNSVTIYFIVGDDFG